MADSELRQRKPHAEEDPIEPTRRKKSPGQLVDEEEKYTYWIDALRVISFLFLASCALSYWISNGESFFWGQKHKPNYMRVDWWKAKWEDRTPDMRGVEDMFLPLDDPETDAQWTAAEMEELKAQERAVARQRVHEALRHWVNFFGNSKKYHRVGFVKRDEGWLEREPRRELCAAAQQGRTKRKPRHGGQK
ncbi:hypothetical protein M440DRAFT_1357485 [Trichoderma longibrachiatum ATCC 18648]|uniref:Uncharacterized protein n=1 Tax=Trichoderma longibrachiatum ATCC 18648 TaxID=983965 RepID=A0A2T4C2U5_TRILO|nr:hypothetical protein M440DRAFT_1357485 [Trichoderma longibrachiatum ATCC 18648]